MLALLLRLLPLLGRIAFGRPRVDGCYLGLQRRVDQSVPCKRRLALELRGYYYRLERLAATSYRHTHTTPLAMQCDAHIHIGRVGGNT